MSSILIVTVVTRIFTCVKIHRTIHTHTHRLRDVPSWIKHPGPFSCLEVGFLPSFKKRFDIITGVGQTHPAPAEVGGWEFGTRGHPTHPTWMLQPLFLPPLYPTLIFLFYHSMPIPMGSGPRGFCKNQCTYGHGGTECLKLTLTTGHPGPMGVLPWQCLAGRWPRVDATSIPFGTLFLAPPPPPSPIKGDGHGENTTPDKQISRWGVAEIRLLKAIRPKIKPKFNENWKSNPYYVAIKNDVYQEFVITWKMLVSLRWARKEQITKLCVQLITIRL